MPDYSLDNLPERAAVAREALADYVADLDGKYLAARRSRKARGFREIAFCGMGRAGKDTAAEYLCKKLHLVYPQSASYLILPLVANMANEPDLQKAFAERHNYRVFWIQACHAIRGNDYPLLMRMCLGAGDVAVGTRGAQELRTCIDTGVIELALWIDNPRVGVDPTVEYRREDCHLVVVNDGTLDEFYAKLDRVIPQLLAKPSGS